MRAIVAILAIIVLIVIVGFFTGFIGAKQTQEGALPSVSVQGGQLPKFDVDTANVSVGTKETTVEVPKVGTETKTVDVPTIAVKKPE
ncbi:hypothetical protein [Sphingomonas sp. ID0503]|uniref:hypothetical protein n=1 Tax=Sphingomonas sp. ID0503 TaxID=3399691 RepID=UPI003AFA21A8